MTGCGGMARLRGRPRRPPAFRRQPAPLRGAGAQPRPILPPVQACGGGTGLPPPVRRCGRRPPCRGAAGPWCALGRGRTGSPAPRQGGGRHRRTVWRGVQAGDRGQACYTAVGGTGGGCGCGRAGAASTSGVCRGAASGAGAWVFFSSIVTPPPRSRLPGSSAPPPGTFPAPPRKRAGR